MLNLTVSLLVNGTWGCDLWLIFLCQTSCKYPLQVISLICDWLHCNWTHSEKQLSLTRASEVSIAKACGSRILTICCCFAGRAGQAGLYNFYCLVWEVSSLTDSSLWACSEPYGERLSVACWQKAKSWVFEYSVKNHLSARQMPSICSFRTWTHSCKPLLQWQMTFFSS